MAVAVEEAAAAVDVEVNNSVIKINFFFFFYLRYCLFTNCKFLLFQVLRGEMASKNSEAQKNLLIDLKL